MPRTNLYLVLLLFMGPLVLSGHLWADSGITNSTELIFQAASGPEAKLGVTQSFTFPFLQGEGPLTSANNFKTALTAEVSPVSMNGITELVWTPIAFFQITGGGMLGSGWNMALGNGIGINEAQDDGTGKIRGDPFGGLIWGIQGGAVLQFDLAAIFPGDWNHLVFRSGHEARWRAFTGASGDESWVFESDDAENQNGLSYYGNYLLGYQMPASPILNMAALLAEMDLNFYRTSNRSDWGDDLPRWRFAAFFNFAITQRLNTALVFQMRTRRNYGHSDLENKNQLFYQNQKIVTGDPYRLVFYRVAVIMTLKLR